MIHELRIGCRSFVDGHTDEKEEKTKGFLHVDSRHYPSRFELERAQANYSLPPHVLEREYQRYKRRAGSVALSFQAWRKELQKAA